MTNVPMVFFLSREPPFVSTAEPTHVTDSVAPGQNCRSPQPDAQLRCYESRSFDPATGSPRGRSAGLPDMAARIHSAMHQSGSPILELYSTTLGYDESDPRESNSEMAYNLRSRARAQAPKWQGSDEYTQISSRESSCSSSSENSSPRTPPSSPKVQPRRHFGNLPRLRKEMRKSVDEPIAPTSFVQVRRSHPWSGVAANWNFHSLGSDFYTNEITEEPCYQKYIGIDRLLVSMPPVFTRSTPSSPYGAESVADYGETSLQTPSFTMDFDYEFTQSVSGVLSFEPAPYGSLLSALDALSSEPFPSNV